MTEALIAHFPARDLDEPVTKEFVDVRIADVEVKIAELRADMAELRTAVRDGDAALRAEMSDGHASLRNEVHDLSARLQKDNHDLSMQVTREVNRALEVFRFEFDARQRQLILWFATIVVSLAGIAVTVALALAR